MLNVNATEYDWSLIHDYESSVGSPHHEHLKFSVPDDMAAEQCHYFLFEGECLTYENGADIASNEILANLKESQNITFHADLDKYFELSNGRILVIATNPDVTAYQYLVVEYS
jgi:hypothetical protein